MNGHGIMHGMTLRPGSQACREAPCGRGSSAPAIGFGHRWRDGRQATTGHLPVGWRMRTKAPQPHNVAVRFRSSDPVWFHSQRYPLLTGPSPITSLTSEPWRQSLFRVPRMRTRENMTKGKTKEVGR
jgi:hypothetical protein